MIHEEISEVVIGAAMKVHGVLKPGLDEKLYENALVVEFNFKHGRLTWKRVVKEN